MCTYISIRIYGTRALSLPSPVNVVVAVRYRGSAASPRRIRERTNRSTGGPERTIAVLHSQAEASPGTPRKLRSPRGPVNILSPARVRALEEAARPESLADVLARRWTRETARSVGGTRGTRINVVADGRKDDGATSGEGTRVQFLLTGQRDDNNEDEDEDEDDNCHDDDDDDHGEDDEEEKAEEEEEEEENRPCYYDPRGGATGKGGGGGRN